MNVDKPIDGQYDPYFKPFVELVKTNFLEAELKQNLNDMSNFLAGITVEQWNHAYQEGKWTIGQVLMHIIDVEHMFVHRAFWVQREMGSGLQSFDHDLMASNSISSKCTPARYLALYEAQRNYTIAFANTLKITDWDKTGTIDGKKPFDIRMLYYVITGHERHHLNVVKERYF